jgi:RNA polymerase primary sigma factor
MQALSRSTFRKSSSRCTNTRIGPEEERALAESWKKHGVRSARDRLVLANLGLVVAIAQRYRHSGVALEDLIAEGNLGLLHAVDGFDPSCGSRLSTYAAYWIRQGIGRAFAANSPRGQMNPRDRRDVGLLERAARTHYAAHGRRPTVEELVNALHWQPKRVLACRSMSQTYLRPSSLDQPRPGNTFGRLDPPAPPTDPSDNGWENAARINCLLGLLSPQERAAVELRFGIHCSERMSLAAIAASLGTTRRKTRVILRTAMARLARQGCRLSLPSSSGRAGPSAHSVMVNTAA